MIREFDNPLQIPKLIELAKEVPNTPLDKLKKFMFATLSQPNTKAYIDSRDGEIYGFIYATIEEFDGERCVFIQFCVIKPVKEESYTGFELFTKMKLWARENNISQLYFITSRDPKGFIRKYHFEPYGSVLKMDLNKEKKI